MHAGIADDGRSAFHALGFGTLEWLTMIVPRSTP
jgi:hypothetical protein